MILFKKGNYYGCYIRTMGKRIIVHDLDGTNAMRRAFNKLEELVG